LARAAKDSLFDKEKLIAGNDLLNLRYQQVKS